MAEQLPEAGDERREVLKRRKDQLDQKAEELSEEMEVYKFDPDKLKVENEIAQHFNALDVTDKQPGYRYVWVNYLSGHGRNVTYRLAKRAKGIAVWEVVRGDMPECSELKAADGTRRIGDVMLMRGKEELVRVLDGYEEAKRRAVQEGVASNLQELGHKYAKYGVKVHTEEDMDPHMLRTMESRAAARRSASGVQDRWIREGNMPGMKMQQR